MNKIYLFAPLAGLLVFGGVYWDHHRKYEARLAEIQRRELQVKKEKLAADHAARLQAIENAAATLQQRKLEREQRERTEAMQKQARLEAEQRRNHAGEHERRLRAQLEKLRAEADATTHAIVRTEERANELRKEQRFLADYVRQAETNRNTSYQLLEQLERVEKIRAANSAAPNPSTPRKNG